MMNGPIVPVQRAPGLSNQSEITPGSRSPDHSTCVRNHYSGIYGKKNLE